jgi:hypothetical protein
MIFLTSLPLYSIAGVGGRVDAIYPGVGCFANQQFVPVLCTLVPVIPS